MIAVAAELFLAVGGRFEVDLEDHADVDPGDVDRLRFGAVGERRVLRAADRAGALERPLPRRRRVVALHERDRGEEVLAGLRVEQEEQAVLARLGDAAPAVPFDFGVEEEDRALGVVVPEVVRLLLVVPEQFAGVRVEGQQRVGVEVLAGPFGADDHRRRVAGADVEDPAFRVDRRRHVDRAAAAALRHPARPRLGHGVELPELFAGLLVVGGDEAADAVLGAGVADVDLAVVGGRGHRLVGPGRGVGDGRGPQFLAGLLRDRLQFVVEGEEEELAVFGGDAAVDRDAVAADPGRLREVDFRRVGPVDVAGFAVDRHDLVGRGGDEDVFADHQREALHQELVGPEVGAPGFAEAVDVAGVDFVLGGEARVVAVAPEERPVGDLRRLGDVGFGAVAAGAAGGEGDGGCEDGKADQQRFETQRHEG